MGMFTFRGTKSTPQIKFVNFICPYCKASRFSEIAKDANEDLLKCNDCNKEWNLTYSLFEKEEQGQVAQPLVKGQKITLEPMPKITLEPMPKITLEPTLMALPNDDEIIIPVFLSPKKKKLIFQFSNEKAISGFCGLLNVRQEIDTTIHGFVRKELFKIR